MVHDNNVLIVADLIDNANREWRRDIITDTFSDADAARIFRIPLVKEPHEDVMVWRCEPQESSFMVRDNNILIVADLSDNANREWRREIITDTFFDADVARVFRIPLAKEQHEDVIVWRCEPSGEFFVRSAYKLLRSGIPSPTFNELQATSRGFYRKLWSLNHACIPSSVDYKLSSVVRDNNILIVVDLIDNANREWRLEIITDTFFDADAARIFQIPLAKEPHEDVMVWRCELSGEFFVQSAYKLLQFGIPSPTFNELQATSKGFYRKLWNLNLPSKIKIT
ncbi:hypothetical protein Goklo_005950, partial [Gossypium klotzschianum]|nr:hypothetical protein [Gossypium klotzschianum]